MTTHSFGQTEEEDWKYSCKCTSVNIELTASESLLVATITQVLEQTSEGSSSVIAQDHIDGQSAKIKAL